MAAFSNRMKALATKLLAKYGEPVSVVTAGEETFDPATGETSSTGSALKQHKGFPYPYTSQEIDGSNVLATDVRVIINYVEGYRPEVADLVSMGVDTYRIMRVESIRAQSEDVAYYLQLRI